MSFKNPETNRLYNKALYWKNKDKIIVQHGERYRQNRNKINKKIENIIMKTGMKLREKHENIELPYSERLWRVMGVNVYSVGRID